MIYEVFCDEASYLTLVVRAGDEAEAKTIGANAAAEYMDHVPQVTVTLIEAEGPPGVIIEDPS